MAFYKICPYCGDNLDPGEKCDCGKKARYKRQCKQSYYKPSGFVWIVKLDGTVVLERSER